MIHLNQTQLLKAYGDFVHQLFERVYNTQMDTVKALGITLAKQLANGNKFWMYGSGHSHILCEEMIDKEGCYSIVNTTCLEEVLGNPSKCGILEREYEFAHVILPYFTVSEGDVIYLISNSGTNGVIVELAKTFKEKGCIVVAHCNMNQSQKVTARHPSKKKMYEYADYIIDNCGLDGDAAFLVVENQNMGATSNMVGAYLLQAINVALTTVVEQYRSQESEFSNGVLKAKMANHPLDETAIDLNLKRLYDYFLEGFNEIRQSQYPAIIQAANLIGDSILASKSSYMFGIGHDHSLVEEIHARAGTIMVNKSLVMNSPELMLFYGLAKAQAYGNVAKYADAILAQCDPEQQDGFLLVSQTFSEKSLIRMVEILKQKQCQVVALVNKKRVAPQDREILNQVDVVMDNCGDILDAGLKIGQRYTGSMATSLSAFALQSYVMAMAYHLTENGMTLPSRISVNTDRGLDFTEDLNRKHFKKMIV